MSAVLKYEEPIVAESRPDPVVTGDREDRAVMTSAAVGVAIGVPVCAVLGMALVAFALVPLGINAAQFSMGVLGGLTFGSIFGIYAGILGGAAASGQFE